ncbi:MAG: hypothetical protein DRJ66_00940 [Thermoprotei archaeon]|nr:MAG: hypothetical protein DRJ66_00940 [Thermoprotei archaeon]RLF17693.1 MAG: hypothetical protein DRZ82_09605 [Thermoprotei archaeon]
MKPINIDIVPEHLKPRVKEIIDQMIHYGKLLSKHDLVMGHGGNLSARLNDYIIITKHGCFIEELSEADFVIVPVKSTSSYDKVASVELPLHRAIYQETNSNSVFHTHSPFIAVISHIVERFFRPIDVESKLVLKEIPIIKAPPGTTELARAVVELMKKGYLAVIAKEHGIFIRGENVRDAYKLACLAEHAARTWYLVRMYRRSTL